MKELIRKVTLRLGRNRSAYQPQIAPQVDPLVIIAQTAGYFRLPLEQAESLYHAYRAFHTAQEYDQRLGESKTLSFSEAFLLYVAAGQVRPSHVVEIGTQYGKSTRRIVDILDLLQIDCPVTCFDLVDQIKYVSHQEVNLRLHDVTEDFRETVLEKLAPELIYLDAHPYPLLKKVISGFLEWSQSHPAILAIHDCGPGLYNPEMGISKDDPGAVSSQTGVWERYVLSEVFGASNEAINDLTTGTHRLRIFSTPHGLALLAPVQLLDANRTALPE